MTKTDNTLEMINHQLTKETQEEQLILFRVGGQEFGIDVFPVQEIIRHREPTKVPHALTFIEGVINFRGEIIPVINMRERLGFGRIENTETSVIIVVEYSGHIFGMTVDAVLDLQNLPKDKIQEKTEFSDNEQTKYLKAMTKFNDRMILVLDLDKIIDFNFGKKDNGITS